MPDESKTPDADEPRIIIDDDWKAQAQRDKEKLAEQVEAEGPRGPIEANFIALLNLLAMQAMVGLGGMAGPNGQAIPPDLPLAKHHIDLLGVLDEKTRGNLTDDEKRTLDSTLYNLRMAYVELAGRSAGMAPQGGEVPNP